MLTSEFLGFEVVAEFIDYEQEKISFRVIPRWLEICGTLSMLKVISLATWMRAGSGPRFRVDNRELSICHRPRSFSEDMSMMWYNLPI